MGRPETPVDREAGPVQRLAHELRGLRGAAGSPSYRTMAEAAEFTAATLSKAAKGERLPSLAVLQAYVRACGGDPAEWESRWKEAEAEVAGQRRDDEDEVPPYRGLARFEPGDRELFFGRDRLIGELGALVRGHRFAVVFGASGSGKSSLLRAGLIPRLQEEAAELGRPAVLRVFTPGARPAETYGHLLAPADGEPDSYVVVDQFEEVFTLCRDKAERTRFIDLLLTAREPGSRLKVLVAVRADFYARCAEHRELAQALSGAGMLVGPMSADELRDVVIKPAQTAGFVVERELAARIVEEVLDEPGGLPMLSHALLETWRRRRGRMLSLAAYETAGGVRGAIAATAEEVYGKLSEEEARTARRVLLRMIEPGQGTPDTGRPLTGAERDEWRDPSVGTVLERLTRARLLSVDDDGVHLAHEALITCWPRLRGWIEEDRERLRHHRRLTEAARVWLEHDRDPGALYRGARLVRTEELFPEHADDPALTVTERAFLTAAFEIRETEHRAAARTRRRARTLVSTLSAVLVVALVAGLVAWTQHRDNQRRSIDDAARRVAEVSDSLRTTDPRTAQLLGLAAWGTAQLPETRRALLGALAQPETDAFTDPAPGNSPLRFLTDSGRTLLSVDGRTWRTWNVVTHRRIASGRLPAGRVASASPDGRLLAVYEESAQGNGDEGLVRLWDTVTGRWTGGAPQSTVAGVDFGADARSYLESGPDDDRVRLRSVRDGRLLFETLAPGSADVAPSADGRLVAVCPSGRAPQVWDIARHHTVPGAWEQAGALCHDDDRSSVVFDGGGRFALVDSGGAHVWDTASGHQVAHFAARGLTSAAFSEDGDFLATADGTEIKVWRLSSPDTPVFRHALNNQLLYQGLTWDPGHPLLRYVEGGTVHTLDVTAAVTSAWTDHPVDKVLLSPDGRTLATAERTGGTYRVQLRETGAGHTTRTLPAPHLPVSDDPADPVDPSHTLAMMTFSPDGTTFAYGIAAPGRDATTQPVTVWDLDAARERTTPDLATPRSPGAVITLALGPGGRALHAVRAPRLGHLSDETWDTARHRRTAVFPAVDGNHLAVRPDGRLLVGDNRTFRLPSGTVGAPDLAQGAGIGALTFAPDGSRLAAGDDTGRVTLWDSTVRHRAGVLRNVFPAPLGDFPEAVSALAISPDGRTLAVGGDAGTLQLWDTATRQPLGGPLTTPGDSIDSLAFSTDSTTLYASSLHVPVQRYTVDPARAVPRICARTGGAEPTKDQWRTYLPDVPYRRVCRG
ncbi:WD40 repeat domain-containing protein [Streptomyces sp. NPDC088350]|uniref:WD40 repeat domain-containing protein n=1 Tax=Streptomyces sp. NPDC088350 TaxID=3365854 RepID=UPI0037F3F57D